jgi:hypothetical protein
VVADVALAKGARDRVDKGVKNDVAVRMCDG